MWCICLTGALYSAGAGWTLWLARPSAEESQWDAALSFSERLHLPAEQVALRLANARGEQESQYIRRALASNPSYGPAWQRLSLAAEFSGRREEAHRLMQTALRSDRTYGSFVAAATQAQRMNRSQEAQQLVTQGLTLGARENDDLFQVLLQTPDATNVLRNATPSQRAEYLRFLIGAEKYDLAAAFEPQVESSDRAVSYRLELCERLLLNGRESAAAVLFRKLYPTFPETGGYNLNFAAEPLGRGYDWRLTQDPGVLTTWRPYELTVEMRSNQQELEILSQFVRWPGTTAPRLEPEWEGFVMGLHWEAEPTYSGLWRIRLRAAPGEGRRFVLRELRLRPRPNAESHGR